MSLDLQSTAWGQLRQQWQESRVVRLGAWLGLVLVMVYGLMAGFDAVDAAAQRNQAQAAELVRLNGLARETAWPERRREALALKVAYDTATWKEPDLALTEANLQDWLRTVAQRLGLKVRELTVVRAEPSAKPVTNLPAGYVELRARLNVEVQRAPLFALLAEMANQERRIVVERFVLRAQGQPATAEIDVRVLAWTGEAP